MIKHGENGFITLKNYALFWVPLEISEFSPTPPHKDKVTSGRSAAAESDKHSVPLSAAALPTDWGDWDSERPPISTQCLGTCSDSLKTDRVVIFTLQETLVFPMKFILFVPFGEIPGNNFRFKYIQVIQVNIFRSLMLAPLPHHFMRKKKDMIVLFYLTSSSS